MAGSLAHITTADGKFTMGLIENLGDAAEALDECFRVIQRLAGGDKARITLACLEIGLADPYGDRGKEQ